MPFQLTSYDLGSIQLTSAAPDAATLGYLLASIDPWKAQGRTIQEMTSRFTREDPAAGRFAILKDRHIVGAVIVRYPFMRGPYLETLGLSSEARGLGIGSKILDWMAAEVKGEARNLWLCVTDWNEAARGFYLARGFTEVGPIPDLATDGTTEIFMRRPI